MALSDTSYTALDLKSTAGSLTNMLDRLGMSGASTETQITQSLSQLMDADKQNTDTLMNIRNMNNAAVRDDQFQRNTNLLAQMNESYNANSYLLQSLATEDKRLSSLDDRARRDLYRLKQEDLNFVYMAQFYRFMSSMTMLTLYILVLMLLPVALWQMKRIPYAFLWIIDGVLVLIYLAIIMFNRISMRRTTDWSAYYWKLGDTVDNDKKDSCD